MHKHNFGLALKLQSVGVTLNIRSLILYVSKKRYLCKFGGDPPSGSEDRAQKRLILQFL